MPASVLSLRCYTTNTSCWQCQLTLIESVLQSPTRSAISLSPTDVGGPLLLTNEYSCPRGSAGLSEWASCQTITGTRRRPPPLNGLYKSEVWEWRFDSCISKLHRHDSQSVNQKFKTHLYSAMMVSQANQRRETAWTMSSVHCKHKQYQTVPSLTYTDSANDVRSTVSNSLSADVRHHPEL